MRNVRLMIRLIPLTVCCLLTWVPPCSAEEVNFSRPTADDGGPTTVYIALGLLNIDEINNVEQKFTANVYYVARWHDPRLAHSGPDKLVRPLGEVWHPEILFVNQRNILVSLPRVVYIAPDGEVEYTQRVWGPFSQRLEMQSFPFDTQEIELRLASARNRPDEVVFEADPAIRSGLAAQFSLPDWEIVDWRLDFSPYEPIGARGGAASVALMLTARRYSSHYIYKILVPLVLIVAMSWIVFWIDPSQSGTQIMVATTSMLTLIAYRFMIGGMIPAVPYLTRMDHFILGSTILVFGALAQAVFTSSLANRGKEADARRADLLCRFAFPMAFAAITILSLAGWLRV